MPPPWDAITPHTPQVVVTAVTAVFVAVTLAHTLVVWRRRGTALFLLILLGGLLCILAEPALDLVSQIYFPRRGAWVAFEAYGRPMPVWIVLSYTLFFGSLTVAAVELLRRGASRARFWAVVAGAGVLDSCLEITMLATRSYFYYGYQPLRIGQLPAVWPVLNALGLAVAVAVFLRVRPFFTGPRVLLAAAVPPLGQVAALWFGTPHFILLNSDLPPAVKVLGSLAAIVAGLLALDLVGRVAVPASGGVGGPDAAGGRPTGTGATSGR